jgi:hypothetical protein
MLKKENSIIFTCSEDESYFSFITFTTNKRVLFSVFAKCFDLHYFSVFSASVCACHCLPMPIIVTTAKFVAETDY